MSSIPDDLKYSKNHIWIKMGDDFIGLCGITDYAQEMLTNAVYIDLPEVNWEININTRVAEIESFKDVFYIQSPVSGLITMINNNLEDSPELINTDPYNEGWIFKIDVKSMIEYDDLMSSNEYEDFLESDY